MAQSVTLSAFPCPNWCDLKFEKERKVVEIG